MLVQLFVVLVMKLKKYAEDQSDIEAKMTYINDYNIDTKIFKLGCSF